MSRGTVAEELAFARKASGLVRGLSMTDAFAVGFMNQGLTPSIWFAITFGLGVFLGGNLIIACLLSFALAGIGFPIVWGVLGGSMPRSGGEYIYNSRIVHPIFGIAQSFGDAMIWLMWIYVLAPLAVDPGLTITFTYLGWTGAADWVVSSAWVTFFLATLFNIVGFLFVVFGIKIFALTQKIVMFFGIGGAIVIGLVLTFTSHAHFVAKWDAAAVATSSPGYHGFIAKVGQAAGQVMPTTWGWSATLGCMVAMSWLFAYAYSISFIGGEVKRPDKTIIWANFFAIAVPFVFMLWFAIVLNKAVGYQFLNASAWNDQNGPIGGFNMPYGTNFIDLAVYSIGTAAWYTKLAAGFMGLSYVAFTLWWVALSYLAFPRILFAWGMDRMGPKWFTDINPRWASPVKNYIVGFVLGELLLVLYYTLLTQPAAEHHRHRVPGHVGVHPDRPRGAAVPLREAGEGRVGVLAVPDLAAGGRARGGLGRDHRLRLPGHPALLLRLQRRGEAVHAGRQHHPGDGVGARRALVLLLEVERSKRVGRRRVHDLRGAAAGVSGRGRPGGRTRLGIVDRDACARRLRVMPTRRCGAAVRRATRGPAAATSGGTRPAKRSKLAANRRASVRRARVVGGRVRPGGARVEQARRHLGAVLRHEHAEHGVRRAGTSSSAPSSAALSRLRVSEMRMRLPAPYGPPDQPVLTSQQRVGPPRSRSASMLA